MYRILWPLIVTLSICAATMAWAADVELEVIVKDGDDATGTTGEFDLDVNADMAASIAIDENAQVFFFSATNASEGPITNQEGIWVGTGEFISDLAIDGQPLSMFQPSAENCVGVGPFCGIIFNTQAAFHVTRGGDITLRTSREDKIGEIAFLSGFERSDLAPLLMTSQVVHFPFSPVLGLRSNSGEFLIASYIGSKAFGEPIGGLVDFVTPFIGGAAPFIGDPVTIDEIYGTYSSASGVTFGFNNAADRLFIARLSDSSEALYFDPNAAGPSRLLARTGEQTPGIGIGEFVELSQYVTQGQTGNAGLNDAGQGYFWGTWRNPSAPLNNSNLPRQALWRFDKSGGPTLVMSEYLNIETDPAFSTSEFSSTAFDNISVPNIAPNGDIFFFAVGREVGANGVPDHSDERVGLWRASAGSPPELVLRKSTSDNPGSPLPDGPNVPGTLLSGGERFVGFGIDGYGLDEHGHLLFATQTAIYAEDEHGYRLVIENGDEVEITPGVPRTVLQARINTLGHVSGQTQAFRDHHLAFRVRFTDDSLAILRTTFLDPPPPPELVGLEMVQVIQDWENSVPVYQGKPTLVRAHLRVAEAELKKVRLRVYDVNDSELDFSPLSADAPAGLVLVGPDSLMKREAKWASANFTLPQAATELPVLKVKVELADEQLACEEAAGPVERDCRLTVNLQEPHKPQIKVFSLNWNSPLNPRVDRRGRMDVVERLISTYPVAEIDWKDGGEVPFDESLDELPGSAAMRKAVNFLMKLRLLDKCSEMTGCKRLYLGLLRSERISGLGPAVAKAAAGFISANPRRFARHVMGHELGHLLGRPHSVIDPPLLSLKPNGQKQGPCGSVAKPVSQGFPYIFRVGGKLRQTFSPLDQGDDKLAYGWDSLQNRLVDLYGYFDLMGYCHRPILGGWPSTHTYLQLVAAMEAKFAAAGALTVYAANQDYWVLFGSVVDDEVSLDPLLRLDDSQPPDTSPSGDWQAQALSSGGAVLESTSFDPEAVQDWEGNESMMFVAALLANPSAVRVRILDADSQVVTEIEASANPPSVTILSPNGGETLAGDTTDLSWQAMDTDGDTLFHAVQFSEDGGTSWETLVSDHGETSITLINETLPATSQGLFRVITSDGFHQASDDSNAVFMVPDSAPTVVILKPGNLRTFYGSDAIALSMVALDTEDGKLSSASLTWVSDQDGALGSGESLSLLASGLSLGTHILTARAEDGATLTGEDEVTLTIEAQRPLVLADLSVDLITELKTSPTAEQAIAFTAIIEQLGDDPVPTVNFTFAALLSAVASYPSPQAVLDGVQAPNGWNCSTTGLELTCSAQDVQPYQRLELLFNLTTDRPADLDGSAEISSAVADPDGGNNHSNVQYRVGQSIFVFRDGFE
ncbi:MAG: hypothetical protein DRR04_10995 [Gammaproteobacteria bacterium]|nr:MAG: hypothetical protein DRR04_10995 [Gammaproteobacteria bacterium]